MKILKKYLLLFFLILLLPVVVSALEVSDKTLSSWDSELDIYPISNSGYIAANSKKSIEDDVFSTVLLKYDSNGKLLWEREFSGKRILNLKEVSDGGYVFIASDSESFVTVKLDSYGNELWSKLSYFDGHMPNDIFETGNGSYLVYINRAKEIFYVLYDDAGNSVTKYYSEGFAADYLFSNEDGGFFVFGRGCGLERKYCDSDYYLQPDFWLESYNSDGTENFSKKYNINDVESASFTLKEIFQLSNDDFIVTYNIQESGISSQLYWRRIDSQGNILWRNEFSEEEDYSLHGLSDGSLLVFNQNSISKYDRNGNVVTTKNVDATYDLENIVFTDKDEFFIKISGKVVKFNNDLEMLWEIEFDESILNDELNITYTSNESIIVFSPTDNDEEYNIFVAKYDKDGNELWSGSFGEKGQENVVGILHINDEFIIVEGENNLPEDNSTSFVSKLFVEYTINKLPTENGSFEIVQENGIGRIVLSPDKGYGLDEIIIKDSEGNVLKYTEKNGEYYFDLADEITVGISYKKSVKNPETSAFISFVVIAMIVSISLLGFNYIRFKRIS